MLTLVFGSTALAVSTVLATYMGGLGLGSYLAGKVADRIKNSVRAYALAEAAIGLYALAVPWLIHFYPGLNHWLWANLRRSLHPAFAAALCGLGRAAHRADHSDGRHPALAGSLLRIAPL